MLFKLILPTALDELLAQVLFETSLLARLLEFLLNKALLECDISIVLDAWTSYTAKLVTSCLNFYFYYLE